MLGWIINKFTDYVASVEGEESCQRILSDSGLGERCDISNIVNYPNDQWQQMISTCMDTLSVDKNEIESRFADHFFDSLAQEYQPLFQKSSDGFELINNLIQLYESIKQSSTPLEDGKMAFFSNLKNKQLIRYHSPNLLCSFIKRLVEMSFNYYREDNYKIIETICHKDGKPYCEFIIEKTAS